MKFWLDAQLPPALALYLTDTQIVEIGDAPAGD